MALISGLSIVGLAMLAVWAWMRASSTDQEGDEWWTTAPEDDQPEEPHS